MSNVDHPAHYKRKGRRECIDEMIEIYGPKDVIAFCELNAFKYEYRAGLKGDAEGHGAMKLIITVLFLAAYYIFIFALMSASEAADNKSKERENERNKRI